MERQIQKTGKRPWAGGDFIKLQDELYNALESIFKPFNRNFVISGCELSGSGPYVLAAGVVFIDGNICEFEGVNIASVSGPIFLNKQITETANKVYGDNVSKPTEKHYKAIIGDANSPNIEDPYIYNNISHIIAPITDSRSIGSSVIYASSKSVRDTNLELLATTVADATTELIIVKYSKAQNKVYVKFSPISQSLVTGAVITTLPANFRPTTAVLVACSSAATIKIDTTGICTVDSGTIVSSTSYYFFEFPIF